MIFLDGLLFRLILWHLFACLQADYFGGLVASNRTCGHSSSVEWKLPKLQRRVRFPLSAPIKNVGISIFLACFYGLKIG